MDSFIKNEEIAFPSVRLVDLENNDSKIMSSREALKLARLQDLDLVLIAENAKPPVVKIVDFNKFKYDQEKKSKELHRKAKANQIEVKEINLRPNTDVGDFTRLQKRTDEWVKEGNKVKVHMNMRGREMNNKNQALSILERFVSGLTYGIQDGKRTETAKGFVINITINKEK